MPIMKPLQGLVTRRSQGHREEASSLPGERTTQPATMQSIMQPSMQANNPLGDQSPTTRGSVQTGPAPAIREFVPGDPEPVASSVAEAPAPVPGQPPATTTSERTHAIIGQDSPLMRQAATRGRQYAHQRGLLNSSLAAGAAQGAVLDRGIELGKADVEDELRTFYAGLDKAKFESDANYRNRALDQEKQLQVRKIEIDERVADSSINIAQERLTFDRDRFSGDSAYRDRVLAQEATLAKDRLDFDATRFRSDENYRRAVLAQEKELQTERLTFDRQRFSSDVGYRDRVLAQEATLAKGRLDFDVVRFRSDENYRRDVLAQEKEFQTERLTFDRQRFSSDSEYRNRVLGQEKDLANKRLDFDKDRFRSDAAYRQIVLAQELNIQTRRMDLTEEENEFRRKFDKDRFESDETYRGEVLTQEKAIAKRRAEIDIEELGVRRDQIKQNGYQGLRNTMSQLYDSYQATVAGIMAIPDMSVRDRNAALKKALDDYDSARRDAGSLSGPSVPVELLDEGPFTPTTTPRGPGGSGGRTDFDNHWNAPKAPDGVTVKRGKSWDPKRGRTTWTDPKYAPNDEHGQNGAICRRDGSWVTYDPGAQTWGCPGDSGFTPHYPPDDPGPDDPGPDDPGPDGPGPDPDYDPDHDPDNFPDPDPEVDPEEVP